MASLTVPLRYPLTLADVPRAINRVAVQVALVRHTFSTHYSREWLEMNLRQALREGTLGIWIKGGRGNRQEG